MREAAKCRLPILEGDYHFECHCMKLGEDKHGDVLDKDDVIHLVRNGSSPDPQQVMIGVRDRLRYSLDLPVRLHSYSACHFSPRVLAVRPPWSRVSANCQLCGCPRGLLQVRAFHADMLNFAIKEDFVQAESCKLQRDAFLTQLPTSSHRGGSRSSLWNRRTDGWMGRP